MIKYLLSFSLITFYSYIVQGQNQKLSECELDSIDGMEVMFIVEQSPEYKGGYSQFYKDFKQNVKFIKKDRIIPPSTVYFSFIVDVNGNIRNFCSTAEIENLEELIEKINHWNAGKQIGEKVPVRLTIQIHIKWG